MFLYENRLNFIDAIETAFELVSLSIRYKIEMHFIPIIGDFLKKVINITNVIPIWNRVQDIPQLSHVLDFCFQLCLREFEAITYQSNFNEMKFANLLGLIRNNLLEPQASIVYRGIVRYCDIKGNQTHFQELIEHVCFIFIDYDFYEGVVIKDSRIPLKLLHKAI